MSPGRDVLPPDGATPEGLRGFPSGHPSGHTLTGRWMHRHHRPLTGQPQTKFLCRDTDPNRGLWRALLASPCPAPTGGLPGPRPALPRGEGRCSPLVPGAAAGRFARCPGGAGAGGGGISPAGWAGRAHVAWRGAGTGRAGPARERRCPAPARHTARRGTAGSLLPTAGAEPRPERQPRRPPP